VSLAPSKPHGTYWTPDLVDGRAAWEAKWKLARKGDENGRGKRGRIERKASGNIAERGWNREKEYDEKTIN